jgi:hypothetical protein
MAHVVDDDSDFETFSIGQYVVQNGGFSSAEKSREHGRWKFVARHSRPFFCWKLQEKQVFSEKREIPAKFPSSDAAILLHRILICNTIV